MSASPHPTLAGVSHLSREAVEELRALLVAESRAQALQCAQHEALVSLLSGLTDVDSVLERELAEAGATRARDALAGIEHALDRLDTGTYGSCEGCGAAIPFERLEAIPAARFCVACSGSPRRLTH